MQSITLIGAVAIAAIAILVLLPSSDAAGKTIPCPKGKSQCPKGSACVYIRGGDIDAICTAFRKDGETCHQTGEGNKKGQFYADAPCEPTCTCKRFLGREKL